MVITLNVSATPEVAGNAAMPLNLGDLDDLIKNRGRQKGAKLYAN